jgi:hypothetical protein
VFASRGVPLAGDVETGPVAAAAGVAGRAATAIAMAVLATTPMPACQ